MSVQKPVLPAGTQSIGLITPGWPLASVPASNPIAGNPGTTPGMNTTDATDLYNAAAQIGQQSGSV
jgi:hypothetical protein